MVESASHDAAETCGAVSAGRETARSLWGPPRPGPPGGRGFGPDLLLWSNSKGCLSGASTSGRGDDPFVVVLISSPLSILSGGPLPDRYRDD
jgi:hypothetical protein